MPPSLIVSNTDSLGEQIQRTFPRTKVVKTLNTVTAFVMADPSLVAGGDHTIFMSGNDDQAKSRVSEILRSFGWQHIIAFPLSLDRAQRVQDEPAYGAPQPRLYLPLVVDGSPGYSVFAWFGPEASQRDRGTAERIVASIIFGAAH